MCCKLYSPEFNKTKHYVRDKISNVDDATMQRSGSPSVWKFDIVIVCSSCCIFVPAVNIVHTTE